MKTPLSLLVLLALALGAGCAEPLDNGDPAATPTPTVSSTDNGDGTTTTLVDATAIDEWILFTFATGGQVLPADPANSTEWDLGFQRFEIKLNGGVSGTGGVALATLGSSANFAAVTTAPASGWLTDAVDGDDMDEDPDLAIDQAGGWYDYDSETHVLSTKGVVYVIDAVDGYYKLEVLSYYDENGTSGIMSTHWAPVGAP